MGSGENDPSLFLSRIGEKRGLAVKAESLNFGYFQIQTQTAMFADIHHLTCLAQGGAVTGITSTVSGTTVASDASVSIYFGKDAKYSGF